MKYLGLFSILLFLAAKTALNAQFFDTGEDPASLKWLQIKTGRFTLIYPESYGEQGPKFASSLDAALDKITPLYPSIKTSYPVVIHNHTTFSNGYVAWAPRRMEIYPTPEQNTIPLDHAEQLALHETTHIMQMYSLRKGFSSVMSRIAGEQFTGLISAYLPMWFLEGDAVLAESLLSPSGRGRTPSFLKQIKAISAEKGMIYSYDKMLNGSFRNYVPDHYQFGYQMTAWSVSKYGHKLWNNVLAYTAKFPFTAVPVNLSLSRDAGLTRSSLFSETFNTLGTIWKKEDSASGYKSYPSFNPEKGDEYVNYYSPVEIGRDSIVAIKTSFYAPTSFVLVNTAEKTERRIHVPGSMYPWFLSASSNGKIAWVEVQPDPRWENRDFSVIKVKSLSSGKVVQLSRNSRYLAATISPDGRFVAASENSVGNRNRLVILDAFNGQVIKSSEVPGNAYPQRPQWSDSGNSITIISLDSEGEGIMSYTPEEDKWETLKKPGRDDLQAAFTRNDTLFYVSSESGTDNICFITPDGGSYALTNSRFGAYDPFLSGRKIWFSDYSASGYSLCMTEIGGAVSSAGKPSSPASLIINRFDTLKGKNQGAAGNVYSPVPYRKWLHPLRIHSWMPFYADIEQIQSDPLAISPGLTLMSQNILSTVISTAGYEYKDGRHLFHSGVTLKGWYPVFESELDYGYENLVSKTGNQVGDPVNVNPGFRITNSVSVPLSFSSGRFSQFFWSSLSARYSNSYVYLIETGKYDLGQTQVTARLYFSNTHMSAARDIYPKWAQVADLSFISFPSDRDIYGPMTSFKSALYFPGFFRNHGIRFRFEYDRQEPVKLLLYNRATWPRGYENIISLDYRFFSTDYTLPLFYPDLNLPSFLYLKRIRGTLFYDYASGKDNQYLDLKVFHGYKENFSSFGAELLSDFYLLRIPFMITGGVEAAWKNLNEAPSLRMVLRLDIYGMKIGARNRL
jgi:hypothetical protein